VASNCSMKAGSMKLRRRNHLFSKVVVLMPKVTLIIGKEEMGWTWIAAAANQLVGNYSAMEHNACAMQADAKGDPDYQERGDGGGLGLPRQRTSWLGITTRWSITLAPCRLMPKVTLIIGKEETGVALDCRGSEPAGWELQRDGA
jgi:hypothetical protein